MKFKEMISVILNQVGFGSIKEILLSTIAWKHKITSVYLLGFTISGAHTFIVQFTEKHIYSPALGIELLFGITILDIILGLSLAVENKKGVSGTKLVRAIVRFIVQCVFVGIFFNMSQVWDHLIQSWLASSILFIFMLSTVYSSIRNAARLGIITKDQYDIIESIVNIKSLFNKIKKK